MLKKAIAMGKGGLFYDCRLRVEKTPPAKIVVAAPFRSWEGKI
jgi:hypothetical protein